MTTTPVVDNLTDLAELAAQHANEGERERRLAEPVVGALRDAGLFRALVPAELGGLEAAPLDFLDVVRALAASDASAAWVVAVTGVCGLVCGYLDGAVAAEVFAADSIVGGVFAPRGRALREDGRLRVKGRWSFASGSAHADWLMVGCTVADGHDVERTPAGGPDVRLVFLPASDYRVHDTWDVAGLRATGSNDVELDGAEVDTRRSVSVLTQPLRLEAPLYLFPLFGLFSLSIACVLLGIAEASIRDLVELAGGKTPTGHARPLAARNDTQARVARAQAGLDAARVLVADAVDAAWATARSGERPELAARAALRRAATHAAETAAHVTGDMYALAGGTSVYRSSPLERRARDMHVGTQHAMVGPPTWELAGRVALALETDTSQL